MASVLFSPLTMRGLTLPNRVVVSPMCQYNSNNGSANDWHLMHLGNMSLGAAGLVMCEMTNVNPQGRISPKCAGMWSDDNEAARPTSTSWAEVAPSRSTSTKFDGWRFRHST